MTRSSRHRQSHRLARIPWAPRQAAPGAMLDAAATGGDPMTRRSSSPTFRPTRRSASRRSSTCRGCSRVKTAASAQNCSTASGSGRQSIKTVGEMIEGLQSLTPQEFRWGVDQLRSRVGLKSLRDVEVEQQLEQARVYRTLHKIGTLAPSPGGGFIDVDEAELDAQRAANEAQIAARRREDDRIERAAMVEAARARQAARDEMYRRQTARASAVVTLVTQNVAALHEAAHCAALFEV